MRTLRVATSASSIALENPLTSIAASLLHTSSNCVHDKIPLQVLAKKFEAIAIIPWTDCKLSVVPAERYELLHLPV